MYRQGRTVPVPVPVYRAAHYLPYDSTNSLTVDQAQA